ncbi:hypothetical protein GGI05_004287, partial [Coemansia sp. RSA 2603]
METLNLHSLILEELSEVLALSYASTNTNASTSPSIEAPAEAQSEEAVYSDPAVWRILTQCPALVEEDSDSEDESPKQQQAVTQRQLNGILALAKLVSLSAADSIQRRTLLPRVLAYAKAAAHYHGPSGGAAHTFARQLTSRLLACASSGSEADARAVLECVWTRMHMLTQQGSTDGAALSGMVAAVESTCYRFTAQDVAQADALLAHGVAGHTLVVVRAVLESRLGERLVAAGALDGAAAQQSGPQELWNAVAQLTSPCGTLPTLADDEVRAYEHMLEASLLAFDEACGEHVMRLSLYAAALSSMLLGRAEPRVTDAMAAHIRGAQAYRLRGVTQTCLR